MLIEWDIAYERTSTSKTSTLLFHVNGAYVKIADNYDKLYDEGIGLLEGRASVSIEYNQVIVTIHNLQPTDYFQFKVVAYDQGNNQEYISCEETFTIKDVKGNFASKINRAVT